jgi:MerR family transcriptional regulator, copper efflux regulator
MVAHDITPGEQAPWPVACTLTAADLAARGSRWEQLAAGAMTGRAETGRGLRLSFRREPGTEEELRALAAAENRCCPWAAWAVRADAGQIVLDVRAATPEGIATLHGMFTGWA